MFKKYLLLFFSILMLSSCTKIDEQSKLIIEDSSSVTIVQKSDGYLMSFEYQINNQTRDNIGPIHINYVFHDDLIQEYLTLNSYSSHKTIGLKGITLKAGETYKGGDNVEVIEKVIDLKKIESIVTDNNAVEMQLIDINTNEIVASKWIRNFQYVDET